MHLLSQKKTRDGISQKKNNKWLAGISTVGLQPAPPYWLRGGILLLLTQVIPWLPPGRISCISQAPSGEDSQLQARAPGGQLLAVVDHKLKAKFSHGKKKMRVL